MHNCKITIQTHDSQDPDTPLEPHPRVNRPGRVGPGRGLLGLWLSRHARTQLKRATAKTRWTWMPVHQNGMHSARPRH